MELVIGKVFTLLYYILFFDIKAIVLVDNTCFL